MSSYKQSITLRLAVAGALLGTCHVAVAADAPTGLDEVVVTATRRSTSVREVPYNIQAVSSQELQSSGVTTLSDLTRLSPGLAVFDEGPRTSGDRNTFNIRGLNADSAYNNDDNPSLSQPAVSTYFGEIPVFFPFKLVDMDHVEVLRGPQGTLYGASSIGGTIRMIPTAPNPHALTVDAQLDASTTDHSNKPSAGGHVTLNLPINETSAFRMTAGHEYLSGFIDAVGLVQQTGSAINPGGVVLQNPGDPLNSPPADAPSSRAFNSAQIDYLRAALLWTFNDRVSATLTFNHQENNAKGRYEDNPNFGSHENYKYYTAFTDPQVSIINLADVDVAVDLGFGQLTSATGVSDLYTDSVSDSSGFLRTHLAAYYFGFPRLFVPLKRTQKVATYTEEVRLVSKSSPTFDWIAGAFFKSSHSSFRMTQEAPGLNDYTNAVLGLSPPLNFTDMLANGYSSITTKDVAVYGELTWHMTDKWQLTGGARVFRDSVDGLSGVPLPFASLTTDYFISGTAGNPYLLGGYTPVSTRISDHIFKGNLSYHVNEQTLAYATVSQGFRSGGANALPALDPLGNDNRSYLLFRPDTDTNYEVGIKGEVGKRFSYSLAAFLVDWKDFQATLYTPFGVNYVTNVGPARSSGVEVDFKAQLTPGITTGLGYSYDDAKVRRAFLRQPGQPASLIPNGAPLPGSAKNSLSAFAEYAERLGNSVLTWRVDGNYRGSSQSDFADLPVLSTNDFTRFPSFTVWGASVEWERQNCAWTLFGSNLSNSRGTTLASTASLVGDRDQSYGVIRPRTLGIRFDYHYK